VTFNLPMAREGCSSTSLCENGVQSFSQGWTRDTAEETNARLHRAGCARLAQFSVDEPGPDRGFFQPIIEQRTGPALDVGCGTGRLLILYLLAGLKVEGIDPSAEMLALCRSKATERGLTTQLYQQEIQHLELTCCYHTIIIPCGTIQLVVDRSQVFEALRRLCAPCADRVLVLTIYNRWREMEDERVGHWKLFARHPLPDRSVLLKHVRVQDRNLLEQTLAYEMRYRHVQERWIIEEQCCDAPERLYFKHEVELLLERIGFRILHVMGDYTDEVARDKHHVLAFTATK
jgi:SAM-dependent methyltransferase